MLVRCTFIWFLCVLATMAGCSIDVSPAETFDLLESTGQILCSFHAKTIHVYFENDTAQGYAEELLEELSGCGISYISLRNKYKTSPVEVIKDDGVLMYLVMILHDASQPLELSFIKKKSAAKHLSHVLLLIAESDSITATWLRKTFHKFWRLWVLNVVIMYWHNGQLQVYRYNPFTQDYLIKVTYPGRLPGLNVLYPTALPNMQGKPLRMCFYYDEIRAIFGPNGQLTGSDGLMSGFIAERLNATRLVHRVSLYGYQNRTSEMCLDEVETALDDVALNTRFLALDTFQKRVEYTIVHSRDDLCVLVPKACTASIFWNLFRSFKRSVWLSILLSLLLAYAVCLVLYRKWGFSGHIWLQLIASSLTLPLSRVPVKQTLRVFFFFWLFYGMLICGAFRGNLMSNLLFRKYLPDLNSITDFALSPYKLFMFPRHVKHLERFLNSSNVWEVLVKHKMTAVPDALLLDHIEANNLSYAYLQKYHVATFQANSRSHNQFNRPLYHVMSDCVVPFHAIYIVPYGSPYLGYINFLIRSALEFGFCVYWDRLMNDAFIQSGQNVVVSQKNGYDPVVLTLAHFQAAYCLLAAGLIAAFLVFLFEVHVKDDNDIEQ